MNTLNEKISIVMTVKNGASHLTDCIESIIRQSYTYWELLVINNNSDDNTQSILESYANDLRIKVFESKQNHNIPSALSQLIPHVTGKFITRMDADDLMHVDKLKLLLAKIENENTIATGYVKYFPDELVKEGYRKYEKWLNANLKSHNPYLDIYKECIIPAPCWMLHTATFLKFGGFENIIPEDYDFAFRCYTNNLKIEVVPEVIHYWREHEQRNSRNDPDYKDNNYFELKTKYFIECDLKKPDALIVWGAGKKGKAIVKQFLSHGITPAWVTDNPSKIGHDIYDIILQSSDFVKSIDSVQVIVALSSPKDLIEVKMEEETLIKRDSQFYYFC